jgi:hypothetical protein
MQTIVYTAIECTNFIPVGSINVKKEARVVRCKDATTMNECGGCRVILQTSVLCFDVVMQSLSAVDVLAL